jgi:hypothetical protein
MVEPQQDIMEVMAAVTTAMAGAGLAETAAVVDSEVGVVTEEVVEAAAVDVRERE